MTLTNDQADERFTKINGQNLHGVPHQAPPDGPSNLLTSYPSSPLISTNDNEHLGQTQTSTANRAPQRRVDHTYRDYSNFPLEELPTRKGAPTNFPSKLHQILSNPEYSHVSLVRHVEEQD